MTGKITSGGTKERITKVAAAWSIVGVAAAKAGATKKSAVAVTNPIKLMTIILALKSWSANRYCFLE